MKQVQPLKYKELPGLTERQLREHHDILYTGYVNKWNQIQNELIDADPSQANPTFSLIRELKLEQSFAGNAIKLHEAYFNCLGDNGEPKNETLDLIIDDFTSFELWKEDFIASGLSSRGWVILSYDLFDNRLYNFSCDAHNQGGMWNNLLLLVLDVYEHAYMIDYGVDRKSYLETYFNNINWEYVNNIALQWDLKQRQAKRRIA